MAPKVAVAKAPSKQQAAANATDDAAVLEEAIASLREYTCSTAVAQLVYVMIRTLWHVYLPRTLGGYQFVPLAMELLAAQVVLFLLFRAGGGFGPLALERPWLLNLYSILSVGILGKCATDCYIYHFAPAMWKHFRPGQPWGVSALLANALAPRLGMSAEQIQNTIKLLEASTDAFSLLSIFRGIRARKHLILAYRKQKKAQQHKKKE